MHINIAYYIKHKNKNVHYSINPFFITELFYMFVKHLNWKLTSHCSNETYLYKQILQGQSDGWVTDSSLVNKKMNHTYPGHEYIKGVNAFYYFYWRKVKKL